MKILAIIMIVLGLFLGYWSAKNQSKDPGDRPAHFNTELGGCMMSFIPLALIVGGIYILMTI